MGKKRKVFVVVEDYYAYRNGDLCFSNWGVFDDVFATYEDAVDWVKKKSDPETIKNRIMTTNVEYLDGDIEVKIDKHASGCIIRYLVEYRTICKANGAIHRYRYRHSIKECTL